MAASRVREGGRTFPDSHTDGPPGSIVALSRPPPLGAILILLPVHGQLPSASDISQESLALVGDASTRSSRPRRRRSCGGWGGCWGGCWGDCWGGCWGGGRGCRDGVWTIDCRRGLCALDPCRRLLVIISLSSRTDSNTDTASAATAAPNNTSGASTAVRAKSARRESAESRRARYTARALAGMHASNTHQGR